jgi:chromosome segregation protein
MLKRLELIGFKSFADKTRFDFAPGLTGIVGPNGSGKSNVVDAVRWILGEQSAKSLRGGEMADVIFNGSSSRKSLGMAEVSLVFDNTRRLINVDADEVQLTRRVYRDGTGEYLINGTAARLKDFKEMFLGSGAGAGGYTIIAQGRVDELLQASTKDRREIFDEAAGISRFKARKQETLRKLAAAEANLTRSQDRLDHLDAQLRTLRMQAAKAQKFREYSDRLRDLRVAVGLREYRDLTAALDAEQASLAQLQATLTGANQRTSELEQRLRTLDWDLSCAEENLRHQDGKLAEARQQIAGYEATWKHERAAAATHEAELLRLGKQRAELGYRLRALEAETARAAAAAAAAEQQVQAEQQAADAVAAQLAAATEQLASLNHQAATARDRQFELVSEAAAARSTATASLTQVQRLQADFTRKLTELHQQTARRTTLAEALHGLGQADADVQARLSAARTRLETLQHDRTRLTDELQHVQTTLEALRVQQGDLRGRIEVLEDLDRSLAGLGAGVRAVLDQLAMSNPAQSDILGLVADLITVPHEVAPLVELALGEAAQRFVVRSPEAVASVVAAIGPVPGRVGFVPYRDSTVAPLSLDPPPATVAPPPGAHPAAPVSLAACVASELPGLPTQLLGNVLLADTLADAWAWHRAYPHCRVVTRTGELLEPDGTLTIGPPRFEAGLVSRKSELRELRDHLQTVTEQIAATEVQLAERRQQVDHATGVIEATTAELELLSGEAGDLQQKIARQRQQVEQLDELIALLESEMAVQQDEVRRGEAAWVAAKLQADQAEQAAEDLKQQLADLQEAIESAEAARDTAQEAHTAAQVALSRAVADRDRARERVAQLESDHRKRRVEAVDLAAAERTLRGRLLESTLMQLRASAGLAEAYRQKEHRERLIAELTTQAAATRTQREQLREQVQQERSAWQTQQHQVHEAALRVHDLQSRRTAVADRIREDYAIELAELAAADPPAGQPTEPPTAAEAQAEIDELRKKLTRLGSVNMEALEELTRLEAEFHHLQSQHEDLAKARHSLQEIIDTINADSRKLFLQTLTAVRGYFQELFRKLFGGGQADIVLEDESDVLECGIEITARPPGKELRSLSLLSGGEKTLTAVALLLAIFRNKPSPFCILDEVDAALDEANTSRLAGVLREFLDRSQFIVITHKKRTMAALDRLWGVTMQESGVSRLLPLRFEDWPDDTANRSAA